LTKFNLNDHIPAMALMRTKVFRGPIGSWGPRL